jgi:hypothetical protein
MRTLQQRIKKYQARALSSLIDPVLLTVNAQQLENFTAYEIEFYPNQVQLRVLLDGAGLMPIDYAAYEAYHGELFHICKHFSGPSAVLAKNALVDKWSDAQHLGAGAATLLNQIAEVIYHFEHEGTP